ncbi:MAG: hypothetical protein A2Z90_18235 [Burkholderiales bacterium GWA2_64_37]|nr:MAG: hypothetical protein A2Z90_18235 [Burkholderiales bacterium GWA2_64_37]HCE91162.1 hypothetical protein [Acidovorax sp.]
MKIFHKRYLNFFGGALGIAGIIFVAGRLYKYADQIHFDFLSATDVLILAVLIGIYGASNLLLAVAWRRVLASLQIQVDNFWAVRIYGVSQLAKYLPGNIFQFAGRQALGMAAGISGTPLLKSTAYEVLMLALASSLFGILAIPLVWNAASEMTMLLSFVAVMAFVGWALGRYFSHHLAAAWWLHSSFLAISGMVFGAALWVVSPQHHIPVSVATIGGAYILAWLVGLLTPGAPAGVGVREAVLLFFFTNIVPPGDMVLAVVIGRIVTVAGDLIFFALANMIQREIHEEY